MIIRHKLEIDMPIYEYACSDCGHKFEALVRTGTVPECPDCHSKELERLLSVFATARSVGPCRAGHAEPMRLLRAPRRNRRLCL